MTGPGNSYQNPNSSTSHFNVIEFIVQRLLGRVRTITIVQVKAVTTSGQVTPAGFVDVLPVLNMLDGAGNAFPHSTVYNLPYFRLQGGSNAVILDPQVGDFGLALICDRDISSFKADPGVASPPSSRRFDFADGIYLGGVLGANGNPSQYVQFTETGMNLVDMNDNQIQMGPQGITLQSSTGIVFVPGNIALTGLITAQDGHSTYTGDINTSGQIHARFGQAGQVGLLTHTHTQPNDSHNDSESPTNPPTAGT